MQKILLIDDSKDTHLILREVFEGEVIITSAYDLSHAVQWFEKNTYDLVLLDIMLPDGDGLEFFARIKNKNNIKDIPFIMLTGKSDFATKSTGFSLGVEDYIVKPFDPLELRVRCLAKMKKYGIKKEAITQLTVGPLKFDIARQRVSLTTDNEEKQLQLTPTGFKILHYLSMHQDQVFSRDQIINVVWGLGTHIVDRTVDTHIGTIRKQLCDPVVTIQSVHGEGYKIVINPTAQRSKKSAA